MPSSVRTSTMVRLRHGVPRTWVLTPVIFMPAPDLRCSTDARAFDFMYQSFDDSGMTVRDGPLGRHRTMHGQVVEWLGRALRARGLAHRNPPPNQAGPAAPAQGSPGGHP